MALFRTELQMEGIPLSIVPWSQSSQGPQIQDRNLFVAFFFGLDIEYAVYAHS